MMVKIELDDGRAMVRFARKAIESHFTGEETKAPRAIKDILKKDKGVFVTLRVYPGKELRGQMGYTDGIMEMSRSLPEVAESAAFRDYRFPPFRKSELKTTLIEVSMLTKPRLIDGDPLKKIKIGKHGLIVSDGDSKGILLPELAVKRGWSPREFISRTCMRGHLESDAWRDQGIEVYTFKAETFAEEEPGGKISRVK